MQVRPVGISLVVLGLVSVASAAQAQTRDETFNAWDGNHDGRLELGEMQANKANFKALDCNHDGFLSRDEFVNRYRCDQNNAAASPVPAPLPVTPATPGTTRDEFARLDRNGDGTLTRGEWHGSRAAFDDMDRNRDGVVSLSEYRRESRDASAASSRFDSLDRNGDGVLSRDEWRGQSVSFATADRNRDGVIDRDEFSRL